MRQFNVLIKGYYSNGFVNCFVLPVNAMNEDEAETSADTIIQSDSFTDVDEYEVLGISVTPFHLKKWSVKAGVTYRSHPQKQSFQYLKVGACDELSAADLVREIISARKGVSRVTITETVMIK